MRRGPALLAVLALLGVAGCGGEEITAEEVPGQPATLSLPPDETLPQAEAANAEDDAADPDASPTATATAEAAAPATGTTQTTPPPATGETGGTAPAQEETAPGNTGGADGNFEDFCEQNPGAC